MLPPKLTKLFGINDFPAAKDDGKVLIIIIYCYLIIIIIVIIIIIIIFIISIIIIIITATCLESRDKTSYPTATNCPRIMYNIMGQYSQGEEKLSMKNLDFITCCRRNKRKGSVKQIFCFLC